MIPGYRLHQLEGNQIYGFRKSGYLLKKSEGKINVKAWRKRKCEITDGLLFIYHSDETKPPTKLNLLTCQVKLVPGKEKKCFDLISFNRTYHFQVEDEHDISAWVYVLINCKEGALKKQFDDPHPPPHLLNNTNNSSSLSNNSSAAAATAHQNNSNKDFVDFATSLQTKDNEYCVDCDAQGPRWVSWNLGVFLCIRCAGIHRNLGVHISRVKSVNLDAWTPEHVANVQRMGNSRARQIYEAKLPADFVRPQTDEELEVFIRDKYEHKKYMA